MSKELRRFIKLYPALTDELREWTIRNIYEYMKGDANEPDTAAKLAKLL
jgi:hypothetical protein